MTRASRDRILKDVNGDISDHLRNHIHLTNCIHLKNHMHYKHSPILADRALMRDLVVLQRSRSLRDPSASPPSWQSPSMADFFLKRGEMDDLLGARQSVSIERPGRMSIGNHSGKEESSGRLVDDGNDFGASGSSEMKGGSRQDKHLKTFSDQLLQDVLTEANDAASSHNNGRLNRTKRRRFRARRGRGGRAIRAAPEPQNEISVASNSFVQNRALQKLEIEEGFDNKLDGQNVTGVPRNNGCGIPWNWSRIHHRGKSFLDLAGRSLSCGLSDSRSQKGCPRMDIPELAVMSELSTSSTTKSDGESLPLLLDASGSQGSINHRSWIHDYSGELGIFADNLLKQETDSDLASEGRSHENHNSLKHHRHQSITQKYKPSAFKDLVGQNLVVQALSNAIVKRKVNLLYLFYGPHGTGKTSCARIFARALNCHSAEHPKPCNFCSSCTSKNCNVKEIGPVSNIDYEGIIDLLDGLSAPQVRSHYKVFIFDECDNLSSQCWSAILKVIDRAPRHVIFVLVSSSLEAIPHVIISRCQKFFFPKLKDANIIYTLQWIAVKEGLEIDRDALKLIASRSEGSLRDAEMTLEQLSLLGKKISLGLVQELVGLISDEKLVDLLDSALSADTVNTVKNLRDIMESGVEPLALMSQLATFITDILAGSYDFVKERPKRKLFRRQTLSKDDMEKLRLALRTLSEAEKQLRVSHDRMTWLTAALLQLAPDPQYVLPSSSTDTSLNHSPLVLNREKPRTGNTEIPPRSLGNFPSNAKLKAPVTNENEFDGDGTKQTYPHGSIHSGVDEIWLEVLGKIPIKGVREFMRQEGKLASLSYGAAPTVQLSFTSQQAKSKAEKFRLQILHAFESVLRCQVTIEIRCDSKKDVPILLPAPPGSNRKGGFLRLPNRDALSSVMNGREIVEMEASPRRFNGIKTKDDKGDLDRQKAGTSGVVSEQKRFCDRKPNLSLVRGKVSLAHVIQQVEGMAHYGSSGWPKHKTVSIAEKIEKENLRLESRSRRLLCWRPPRSTGRKLSRLKTRTRKPQTVLKFVSCGRCLSGRSPRSR